MQIIQCHVHHLHAKKWSSHHAIQFSGQKLESGASQLKENLGKYVSVNELASN